MIPKPMSDAIIAQINAELYSAYLYLSMATWCSARGLTGAANWMKAQTEEEIIHAMKFNSYLNEHGARVVMKAIDAPPTEWDSPLAVFRHVLEHERKVTGLIHGLVRTARGINDLATESFLKWYVDEQVEEEGTAEKIVKKLELVGDDTAALYVLDRELAARAMPYVPRAATG